MPSIGHATKGDRLIDVPIGYFQALSLVIEVAAMTDVYKPQVDACSTSRCVEIAILVGPDRPGALQ